MTVSHLLLLLIPTSALTFLFAWLQTVLGVSFSFEARYWASFPFALVTSIFLVWPLARLLRVPPLMIFSGPCPACERRPPGWRAYTRDRDKLVLACGLCGERIDLWLTSAPGSSPTSSIVHSYVLRSPRFLGVWRRLDSHERARQRR